MLGLVLYIQYTDLNNGSSTHTTKLPIAKISQKPRSRALSTSRHVQPPSDSDRRLTSCKAKYKYQAWEKEVNAGVTPEQAQKKYIELVESCKKKYGFDAKATKSANGEAINDADLKRFDTLAKQTGKTY